MGRSERKTSKSKKNPAPATSAAVPGDVAASTPTSTPASTSQPGPAKPSPPADGPPTLESWMKQTVVLQLKEVDGRVPDMTPEIFGKKMILEQGFSKAETLSVQAFTRELFARSIRRNPEIRGITAPGPDRREVKCSLYMDDVTVFCADRHSIDTLAQTCEDFGQASGAKVNCGKSEVMLFGKWFLPSSAPMPFSVKADFIKILGVWFGAEGAALKSWEERLAKMQQKFGLWSLRELTIEGKTLIPFLISPGGTSCPSHLGDDVIRRFPLTPGISVSSIPEVFKKPNNEILVVLIERLS
ncbi:uncharacterized protein LOC143962233 [Lithobates pipiens]